MPIGFYARGLISLPLAPFPKATLRLIETAISEAWRVIRETPEGDFDIANSGEDRITLELRNCLTNTVLDNGLVPGFTSNMFYVTREAKYVSFDGTHLDKMPDLHFRVVRDGPVSLPSEDGLFVECKPVDREHPAGRDYCDRGIIRFVKGDYAWALPQALMVGYVLPGYSLPEKLDDALTQRKTTLKATGSSEKCPDWSATAYCQHPHVVTVSLAFHGVAPRPRLRCGRSEAIR
jgi:hypothetical protein